VELRRRGPPLHAADRRQTRARSKAIARVRGQLQAAARAGDSTRFFGSARAALQSAFAARWNLPPEQITAPLIRARLGDAADAVGALFELADEVRYSGTAMTAADYAGWTRIVERQLTDGNGP
jgi:hypothetical protein